MVVKKKVAIVIGRYYLTLPIIIGFYHLFDWELDIIDVGMDTTNVAKEDFYRALPPSVTKYRFRHEPTLFKHFRKRNYDIVFATTVKHKDVNQARALGLISRLYVIFGAFLKPPAVPDVTQATGIPVNTHQKGVFFRRTRKMLDWRSYYSFVKTRIKKLRNFDTDRPNNPDACDRIICWNKAEAHYYNSPKQIISPHPYHLLSASRAKIKPFSGKILIAHSGDPLYYTPGYNELINRIIEQFSPVCEVAIKVHPLCQDLPKFNGEYQLIYKAIDEEKVNQYDIFINEDSYMGVEMFFRGKYVINFGTVNKGTSNRDFTHLWANDEETIIREIHFVIDNWTAVNEKHTAYLKQYFAAYIPPVEFGPLAVRAS
jgi:hypothetical protein